MRLSHGEDDLAHFVIQSSCQTAEVKRNAMEGSRAAQPMWKESRIWVSGFVDEGNGFGAAAWAVRSIPEFLPCPSFKSLIPQTSPLAGNQKAVVQEEKGEEQI